MSVNETATQNVSALKKSLCVEIFVCVPSWVLAGETSARPLKGGQEIISYTGIVCQEKQGPWLLSHKCVTHIWLTARQEYVVSICSKDWG
jgi:hypothetical protein